MPDKVLVIDDCQTIHTLVKVRLGKEPVTLLSAHNGVEGIAMANREKPDLILLDVEMPGLTGFDVCRKLKADSATMQ
ncbi:MAG TPA: response regulator, partial [Phycisphaerae bacterium]|nr:response regulator [Phycisphaerae bacterium]